jgi:AcrR family transcriptional regulator
MEGKQLVDRGYGPDATSESAMEDLSTNVETKPARAGRPRSAVCQNAILKAAFALLAEQGLAGFTIEAVSARSGVARTTIYRRWPTKGVLAVDSFLHSVRGEISVTPTASAVDDLRAAYLGVIRLLQGDHGRILASILAEGHNDPGTIAAFVEGYLNPARTAPLHILQRGIKLGQFREDADPHLVLDLLFGAIYRRLLLLQSLDEDWGNAIFDVMLSGFASSPPVGQEMAAAWQPA